MAHLNRIDGKSPQGEVRGADLYQKAGLPLIEATATAFLKKDPSTTLGMTMVRGDLAEIIG
ncbi:hypothetical protein HDC90_003748 [Pedobacter sp. AK013]|uniref:hypothetical protein n=1 Tax=Pedobacter sp. AK013 TaxID=2723071 RepID=UPI00161642E7|nr:hypothetical protein [Pedobacter sp. AK013]MBB6239101.1 hypothetical protein [Pedobacter sp. AK013]